MLNQECIDAGFKGVYLVVNNMCDQYENKYTGINKYNHNPDYKRDSATTNYMDHVKYFLSQRNFDFTKMCGGEAIYIFKNELTEYPKCECGETLKYNKPRCSFNAFCSCKCPKKNQKATDKRKSTCIEKYSFLGRKSKCFISTRVYF